MQNKNDMVLCMCIFTSVFLHLGVYAQQNKKSAEQDYVDAINIIVGKELQHFPDHAEGAVYSISLCADVPNNKKPKKVAYQQQTGHVFLILQMISPSKDTSSQVFGFYPKRGLPTLIFKKIKSVIKDNSYREYDARVTKHLNRPQFDSVVNRSILDANRIYHINKYNCYDYAVQIFNSIVSTHLIPSTHVRFPFIFGRGGSPVGLYMDLQRLKTDPMWIDAIHFDNFTSPKSSTRVIRTKNMK